MRAHPSANSRHAAAVSFSAALVAPTMTAGARDSPVGPPFPAAMLPPTRHTASAESSMQFNDDDEDEDHFSATSSMPATPSFIASPSRQNRSSGLMISSETGEPVEGFSPFGSPRAQKSFPIPDPTLGGTPSTVAFGARVPTADMGATRAEAGAQSATKPALLDSNSGGKRHSSTNMSLGLPSMSVRRPVPFFMAPRGGTADSTSATVGGTPAVTSSSKFSPRLPAPNGPLPPLPPASSHAVAAAAVTVFALSVSPPPPPPPSQQLLEALEGGVWRAESSLSCRSLSPVMGTGVLRLPRSAGMAAAAAGGHFSGSLAHSFMYGGGGAHPAAAGTSQPASTALGKTPTKARMNYTRQVNLCD